MNTLYSRLALLLIGLLGVVGLIYILLSQSLLSRYLETAHQRFNRNLAQQLIADQALIDQGRLNQPALKALFERYMTINPGIEIYLLDAAGKILAFSAEKGAVVRNRVGLEPVRAFLAGRPLPLLGDDPRSHERRASFSAAAVPLPDSTKPGYLYVVLRGETYASLEQLYRDSALLRLSAWVLVASLGCGLLLGLIVFALLTRRLRRLTRAMAAFERSEFQHYTPTRASAYNPRYDDEIDQLSAHFDGLALRVQQLIGELRQRDVQQRELFRDISHDLRTPLTCVQGYLETLQLKANQQTASSRLHRDYVNAALSHVHGLNKLVNRLFELAKLEANLIQPTLEPFLPAELLHDIAQKFRPAARQHGIRLLLGQQHADTFVNADIGMTERVLENLIGNALRYTPAGGKIYLTLRPCQCGKGARIAVVDTGPGIAADRLPHLFNRYYSSAGHANHLGLGLAIAAHLVRLQHGQLRVASQVGVGTRFSFCLPQTGVFNL